MRAEYLRQTPTMIHAQQFRAVKCGHGDADKVEPLRAVRVVSEPLRSLSEVVECIRVNLYELLDVKNLIYWMLYCNFVKNKRKERNILERRNILKHSLFNAFGTFWIN